MRGKSVCRSEEDLYIPLGVCLVARVPTKAIFTMVRCFLQQHQTTKSASHKLCDDVLVLLGYEASRNVYCITLNPENDGGKRCVDDLVNRQTWRGRL